MALRFETLLLIVTYCNSLTGYSKINNDRKERQKFSANVIYTSSLASSTIPTRETINVSTISAIRPKTSPAVAIAPTSSLTSNDLSLNGYSVYEKPLTLHLVLSPISIESPMHLTTYLQPTMSYSELPMFTESINHIPIQSEPSPKPFTISVSPKIMTPTREAISLKISPTPVLKPKEQELSQILLLEGDEWLPQSSPAPVLQPSEMFSVFRSTTMDPFKESSTFGHYLASMVSMTSTTFIHQPPSINNMISSGHSTTIVRAPEYKTTLTSELLNCVHLTKSCRGYCGEILGSCSCDINCGIYKVCCDDFEDACPDISEDARKSLGGLLDVKIECVGEYTSYLVIAGCPNNYTSADIIEECVDGKVLINSIDGLHFRNIACLRCHGFTEAETEKWTMSIFVNYGRDKPLSFFAVLDADKVTKTSPFVWKAPKKILNTSRACSPEMIDKCPADEYGYIAEKCSTNNANVFIDTGITSTMYKNIYCAYCNDEPVYFCRGTTRYDYHKGLKVGRFSSIISMRFDVKSERFELEATKPFIWRKAECKGSVNNLNCFITKCFLDIPPANNTCGLQMTETCVWMEFSTSGPISKGDLLHFANVEHNNSLSRPDMQIERVVYSFDVTNRNLKFRLLFRLWTGPLPYTLDDLYDSYSAFAGGFLMERGLRGEFSLCFNMIPDMNTCYKLKCQPRNYTIPNPPNQSDVVNAIQEPFSQGSISNGGITFYSRSRDGDKLAVALCFFVPIIVTCRILDI